MATMTIPIGEKAKEYIPINDSLGAFVSRGISAILLVAGLATFVFLVLGGVEWITSGGEKDKIDKARNRITNAVIGLAIVAAAYAIYRIIDYFFGIGIA